MTKKQKTALAIQALEIAIDSFTTAMSNASIHYVAKTGRKTPGMDTAWEVYVEACKRLAELSN